MNRLNIKWFIGILILLNAGLAIYSKPINDLGDEGSYILLGKVILGIEEANLANRSPLYSIILAGFMLFFQPPFLFKAVILFQYLMTGLTAWLIFKLFRPLFTHNGPAMLIGILFNISLSTIYYANIILTEILTVFLLVLVVYFFLKLVKTFTGKNLVLSGVLLGLLSLARFNAIPIIVTFSLLLGYLMFQKKMSLSKSFSSLIFFIIPCLLIINLWCLYNYTNNGFYGLFPGSGGGVSRNVVVASIRPDNKVTSENEPILEIFLKAREQYLKTTPSEKPGSMASLDKLGLLNDLNAGYPIYNHASIELRDYFGLKEQAGEFEMSLKLKDFYKEIYKQNRAFVLKMRFISFFSGFRASASALPVSYGKINTNILPPALFFIYKVIMLFVSVLVFLSIFTFILRAAKNNWQKDFSLLIFYAIVISFWGINFCFITVNDANRFKFPAEPFIIGLFVYYFYSGMVKTGKFFHIIFTARKHLTVNGRAQEENC